MAATLGKAGLPANVSNVDECFMDAVVQLEQQLFLQDFLMMGRFSRIRCSNESYMPLGRSLHPAERHGNKTYQALLGGCMSPKAAAALRTPYEPACPLAAKDIASLKGFREAVQSPACGECVWACLKHLLCVWWWWWCVRWRWCHNWRLHNTQAALPPSPCQVSSQHPS